MRKLLIFLLPAILLAGCSTELVKLPEEAAATSLVGKWELRQHFGGMIPGMSYAPGNGNFLIFDNSTYRYINNGQVVRQGNYVVMVDSVVDVNSCELIPAPDLQPNRIVFDNETQVRMNYSFFGRAVKIHSGCIPLDGGGSVYYKIEGE